jgi:N4-gp56 family major capsid protein
MSQFGGLSAQDFLSDADTKVAYSQSITKEVTKKSKVKPFIATSENDTTSIIKTVLKTCEIGSVVGVEMEDSLIESGAVGNVDFATSGEELKNIKQFIKIDRFQHAVPSTQSIVNQRNADKFKTSSKERLTNWGTMKFDKIFFSVMSADCTNIVACGHHGDETTEAIVKANVLTTADIEEAKRRALLGVDAIGGLVPPLLPIRTTQNENAGFYDEVEMFIMFVGTNTARNIKNDANWEAARLYALERGKTNPIFTGALGFHDGVLLLDVKTDTQRQSGVLTSKSKFNGFGNVKVSDLSIYAGAAGQETEINLLVGAGACHMVVDMGVAYYDWADKSDPRRMNAGIDRVYGMAKTKYSASANDGILQDSIFDGKDYGVVAVVASTGI